MAAQKRFAGLIEEWPSQALLYIPVLPGFILSASSRDELIDFSLDAIDLHLAWLESHLAPLPLENNGGLVVREVLSATGATGPLFDADRVELTADEIENALSLGRIALSDIIDLVDVLESVGKADAEMKRIVLHICVLDIWYSTRLGGPDPALRPVADALAAMIQAGGLFEVRIDERVVSGFDDPGDVTTIDGEDWTVAKLLRRRTAHIREHSIELAALLPEESDEVIP